MPDQVEEFGVATGGGVWVAAGGHYNVWRPHKNLDPGVPNPPKVASVIPKSETRHRLPAGAVVFTKSALGGLHHEYSLTPTVI